MTKGSAKKAKETAQELPQELTDLLATPDDCEQVNSMFMKGKTMEELATDLAFIDRKCVLYEKIFRQSGFPSVAAHFKGIVQSGRTLAREINRQKPHADIVLKPEDLAPPKTDV